MMPEPASAGVLNHESMAGNESAMLELGDF